MKYRCDPCDYETYDKSHFSRHIETRKHGDKVLHATGKKQKMIKKSTGDNIRKDKSHQCEHCNKIFSSRPNLLKHINSCKIKKVIDENKDSKLKIEMMQKEIDDLKALLHNNQNCTTITGNKVYNISVKANLDKFYKDAPELLPLDDYSVIEDNDDDLIDSLAYNFRHNMLDKYFGEIIIKYYKKDDTRQQSLWNSDESRLKYIVREILDKKAIWTNDPKGVKTKKYIIEPLLSYIRDYIKKYLWSLDAKDCYKRNEDNLKIQKKLFELGLIINVIDTGCLANDIIKFIAPYFTFNKKDDIKMIKQ